MLPKILCVIPSRLNSTRLPKKPLALIGNKPMIQWVYEAAAKCSVFSKVIVATDAQEIAHIIQNIGGSVEMTPAELQTGSDRVAYVAQKYSEYPVVVNLQGDEPFVKPEMLVSLVEPYLNGKMIPMSTLACPLDINHEYNDPNTVKVLVNKKNDAIYFSRSPIPFFRQQIESTPVFMHLGMYAYARDFLLEYTKMEQTLLEKAESLEQLRALENGIPIRVCQTPHRILEVNNQEELDLARKFAENLV